MLTFLGLKVLQVANGMRWFGLPVSQGMRLPAREKHSVTSLVLTASIPCAALQRERGSHQNAAGVGRGELAGGAARDGPAPSWMGESSGGGAGRRMTAAEMEAEHQAVREAARARPLASSGPRPPVRQLAERSSREE